MAQLIIKSWFWHIRTPELIEEMEFSRWSYESQKKGSVVRDSRKIGGVMKLGKLQVMSAGIRRN